MSEGNTTTEDQAGRREQSNAEQALVGYEARRGQPFAQVLTLEETAALNHLGSSGRSK